MTPRMTLAEARAVLNGDVPASAMETGYATGMVLAYLDEIQRRAEQVRGGLKPYARPVEIVDYLMGETE